MRNEPLNSRNIQRVLLPLEPDFSTMSDPSIVNDPQTNTWESNRLHLLTERAEEINLNQDIRIRREEDTVHLHHLLLHHHLLCLFIEEVRSQRSLDIHMRKEDVVFLLLLLLNL